MLKRLMTVFWEKIKNILKGRKKKGTDPEVFLSAHQDLAEGLAQKEFQETTEEEESILIYQTRNQEDARGKKWVYFCCDAEDYSYFEEIASCIHKHFDCAIWYDSCPGGRYHRGNRETDLEKMQLFIVPVTRRMLEKDSRTLMSEIRLARNKYIPVLPLMMESGLEELFAERFGSVQYLDYYNADETAISFEEKLEAYLSKTMIDDGLVEEIEQTLKAKIFLSYRKKDRKYANEFVERLHKNKKLQEVGFWYDEFLTPGENYHREILGKILKSDLFVVIVTPHLVNEKNYIVDVEYPFAVEFQKDILAVEMCPTDRKSLKKQFGKITGFVENGDIQQLWGAIEEKLEEKLSANPEQENRHMYLMGMAYLNGIFVERNVSQAIKWLEMAADAGCEDAYKTLVDYYWNSHTGVKQFEKAICWQERYIEACKNSLEEKVLYEEYERLRQYCSMAWDRVKEKEICIQEQEVISNMKNSGQLLAENYKNIGEIAIKEKKPQEAISWYEKGISILETLEGQEKNLADCYSGIADGYALLEQFKDAREWYQKALLAYDQSETEETDENAAKIYIKLGELALEERHPEAAKEMYEKGIAKCSNISDEMQFQIYIGLGRYENEMWRFEQAETWYEKAYHFAKKRMDEQNLPENQFMYIKACYYLGKVWERKMAHDISYKWYVKSIESCKRLFETKACMEVRLMLAEIYSETGEILRRRYQYKEAIVYCEKCLQITSNLKKKNAIPQMYRVRANAYYYLCFVNRNSKKIKEAWENHDKSLQLYTQLMEENPSPLNIRNVSNAYWQVSRIWVEEGNMEKSYENMKICMELEIKLHEVAPTIQAKRDLAFDYEELISVCKALGKYAEAISWGEKGMKCYEDVLKEINQLRIEKELGHLYCDLGEVYELLKQLEKAHELYEKSMQIRIKITEKFPQVSYLSDLAQVYNSLGDVSYEMQMIKNASDWYFKAYEIFRKLHEEHQTPTLQYNISISYRRFGKISLYQGRFEDAYAWYKKGYEIANWLAEKYETIHYERNVEGFCSVLGDVCKGMKKTKEAYEWYEKGLKIGQLLIKKSGDSVFWADLVDGYYNLSTLMEGEEKMSYLEKACEICKMLSEKYPEVDKYERNYNTIRTKLDHLKYDRKAGE